MRPGAVQIAGVHDVAEAEMLADCGVDFVGLPLRLAHHVEDCDDAEARRIVSALQGRAACVLITYLRRAAEIAELARSLGVAWVQLHGEVAPEEVGRLRSLAPGLRLAKSLVVRGEDRDALERAVDAHAPRVDAFLTDSFDPDTGAEGATGRTHEWSLSAALVRRSPHSLVLAGGLTPDNVYEAILCVRPAAVDAHTGVEDGAGRKDEERVRRFVSEARRGFATIGVAG